MKNFYVPSISKKHNLFITYVTLTFLCFGVFTGGLIWLKTSDVVHRNYEDINTFTNLGDKEPEHTIGGCIFWGAIIIAFLIFIGQNLLYNSYYTVRKENGKTYWIVNEDGHITEAEEKRYWGYENIFMLTKKMSLPIIVACEKEYVCQIEFADNPNQSAAVEFLDWYNRVPREGEHLEMVQFFKDSQSSVHLFKISFPKIH